MFFWVPYLILVNFGYVGVFQVVRVHLLFVITWNVGFTPNIGYRILLATWYQIIFKTELCRVGNWKKSLCAYFSVYLYLFVWICVSISLCFFVFVLGSFYVCVCVCLFLFVYVCVKTCVIGLSPPPMYCLSNETDRWLQLVLAFVKMIQPQKRSIQNRGDKTCT